MLARSRYQPLTPHTAIRRIHEFVVALAIICLFGWQQDVGAQTTKAKPPVEKTWTGDLDGMLERRVIRALVPYNKTLYFVDKGASQHGLSHDLMVEFEKFINHKHHQRHKRIYVVFIPTERGKLIEALRAGQGDIIAANLTITPAREKVIDFATPLATNVKEIIVTGPKAAAMQSLNDLSGKKVLVNPSSSYADSLRKLNEAFKQKGLAPIELLNAPENFETEDAIEMVQAGLVDITVADAYLAAFWKKVFPNLRLYDDLVIRQGASVAFGIRKNSPELKAVLDEFMAKYGIGTRFGNSALHRYLRSVSWAKRATDPEEFDKAVRHSQTFQKYADQYDMDWLLMLAQGYQESGLNQNAHSPVGAIGVMQLMPATGRQLRVGDIHIANNNIHGGVKYMRSLIDHHFKDDPMSDLNKGLFALAAYNAGPGRIHHLRQAAEKKGLDPNKWFDNVEIIVSEHVGRETTQYVSNIYKYYLAFDLLQLPAMQRTSNPVLSHGTGAPKTK